MEEFDKIIENTNAKFMAKDDLIGRHKYNSLKIKELSGKIPLTKKEKLQIETYENKGIKPLTEDQLKPITDYYKKVSSPKPKNEYYFKPKELLDIFMAEYKKYVLKRGCELIINDNVKSNILPLIYYFTNDTRFFKCSNVHGEEFIYNGKAKQSIPSFKKGILIIGNYGNGKTSSMKIFQQIFSRLDNLKFRSYPANEIIDLYECVSTSQEKANFWYLMKKDVIHFGDVKTERIANNYGSVNIFKDIIEKREERDLKTYMDCNFRETKPGDLKDALLEFGQLYGSRVFDRVFKMFNVIEFKGSSFRK